MFHRGPFRWVLVRLLGAPEGESPGFYRDMVLSLPFTFAGLVAMILAFELKFSKAFWVATGIAAVSLLLSSQRAALLAALFVFTAIRCVVGFTFYGNPTLLGVGAVAGMIAGLIVMVAQRREAASAKWRWRSEGEGS